MAAVAVTAALVGTPAVAYAATSGTGTATAVAKAAAPARAQVSAVANAARTHAPTPRIVAPGEHVTAAPGFELWLTPEGKHWFTPSSPEPEFRSVVDGNIDLNTPGVSMQAEISPSQAYLSGLYYGGKGTASRVVVTTKAGTVQGKLIELADNTGWGVWYATADFGPGGTDMDFITAITVYDTKGKVYAQLKI
ncbi:hypothetical protein Sm713_63200 [Streptomyces sp. TS71-3]|nr:hypothetical protein Sm713_63200 [Streptomyces sp. TS71-3]